MSKKRLYADVDEALHRAVKSKAAGEGKTISEVVEQNMREYLQEKKES